MFLFTHLEYFISDVAAVHSGAPPLCDLSFHRQRPLVVNILDGLHQLSHQLNARFEQNDGSCVTVVFMRVQQRKAAQLAQQKTCRYLQTVWRVSDSRVTVHVVFPFYS